MSTLEAPAGLSAARADFIRDFYATSDNEAATQAYVDAFTSDGTIVMGAVDPVSGADGIRKLREGMWKAVAKRTHKPRKVYLGGSNSDAEVMLYGSVDYVLRNGKTVDNVEWAGRIVFASGEGPVKMSYYQVWLDAARMKAALA